jgi:hypothetical protein
MLTDLLTMTSGNFKNERDGVLVDVKNPGAGTNAIALSQCLEHTINGRFIGVEPREDTAVARRKFSATFQTTIKSRLVGTIVANPLQITLNGLAPVGAAQSR